MDADLSSELQTRVSAAHAAHTPLHIVGGDSKHFYGRAAQGTPLIVAGHRGIVAYESTELVLTARAGTPLVEIETVLAERGQMLPFEPPHFGPGATLGGTLACGFSGPRRPYAGAARDFVLGVKIINGRGEILSFGGQVMKNVAGFDVSRLMVGALGTLGVMLEVSLKVLPRPASEVTLTYQYPPAQAIEQINRWAGQPLPLSGVAYDGERIYLRLSGSETALREAKARLGGTVLEDGADFWLQLREQQLPFFQMPGALWRLSLPAATPPVELVGAWLIDWGGAQRWLCSDLPPEEIRSCTARLGGHATLFRSEQNGQEIFHPLSPPLLELHRRLKLAFDPHAILNPGRMYAEW